MNRRRCLALLGMIAALPTSALAQQPNATRRLGVLSVTAADDAIGQTRSMVLVEALAGHGWKERDNLKIDWRSGGGDRARIAQLADELIALKPDILLAVGTPSVEELRRRTTTIPIVFAVVTDPRQPGLCRKPRASRRQRHRLHRLRRPARRQMAGDADAGGAARSPRLHRLQSRDRAVRAPDAAHG